MLNRVNLGLTKNINYSKSKTMNYNNEFEKINTEEKAYVLGLLYSDGCISTNNSVSLAMTDEQLIKRVNTLFPFFNYTEAKNNTINSKILFTLRKHDKLLWLHLTNNGLIPNKSVLNKELVKIPNISSNLISHFIRGYFDGDGSIYSSKRRPNSRMFEICATAKQFLESLNNLFKENNINLVFKQKKLGKLGKTLMYVIRASKYSTIMQLKEFLYKDATIYLNRKKVLFDTMQLIDKKTLNPDCLKCGGVGCQTNKSIEKIGSYIAQKYYCTLCKNILELIFQAQ
jgi:intein/homing endonuclease